MFFSINWIVVHPVLFFNKWSFWSGMTDVYLPYKFNFLKVVFTWENSHRPEFHTGMTFWFCIPFTRWLGHFISRYLSVHFMSIKYTCDSKSQTLRMRYPFQSTGRSISHRNVWLFRVYMIPLRDFVPEWNSRPGTTGWTHAGVTHASMTFCGGIM